MTPADDKIAARVARLREAPETIRAAILAEDARQAAEAVAAAMQLLHGSEWRVRIDHDSQFVSIRRRFPR